jgi:hypothetical protein
MSRSQLSSKKSRPLFEAGYCAFVIGFVFVQALVRTELLEGEPAADQPEAAMTLIAATG